MDTVEKQIHEAVSREVFLWPPLDKGIKKKKQLNLLSHHTAIILNLELIDYKFNIYSHIYRISCIPSIFLRLLLLTLRDNRDKALWEDPGFGTDLWDEISPVSVEAPKKTRHPMYLLHTLKSTTAQRVVDLGLGVAPFSVTSLCW